MPNFKVKKFKLKKKPKPQPKPQKIKPKIIKKEIHVRKPKTKADIQRFKKIFFPIFIIIIITALYFVLKKLNLLQFKIPSIGFKFYVFIVIIFVIIFVIIVVFAKKKPIKKGEKKPKQKVELKVKYQSIRPLKKSETELDLLLELINKNKTVPLGFVVKRFGINKEKAECWAKILEDHNLITIYYPAFGEPLLKVFIKGETKE